VLLYHRISDHFRDPYRLNVSPANFAEHLEVLRKRTTPVTLDALVRGEVRSKGPRTAVAITFDDGYADNLFAATPLLERAEIPATVFVTTGTPGGEFWWDTLARMVLSDSAPPEQLDLTLDSFRFLWPPAGLAIRPARLLGKLRRQGLDSASESRRALLKALHRSLRAQSTAVQSEVLHRLADSFGVPVSSEDPYRAVDREELARLARCRMLSLGAHTVTHPVLAALPPEACRQEIIESRRMVEEAAGARVQAFSYPYGQPGDYTAAVQYHVREAGFDLACAAHAGIVTRTSDPLALPRLWAENCDGEDFGRRLRRWLPW
jgi:peptidoglycan/xylan/chitin deacetylase (PgdA/CDA1 family)